LAIVGGFVLTLAIFLSGAAVAAWFLTAKPVPQPALDLDQAEIWTEQPRTVDTAQQFERLPARPVAPDPNSAADFEVEVADKQAAELMADNELASATADNEADQDLPSEPLDMTATASVEPVQSDDQPAQAVELNAAHVEWCANRYRSYRPRDNAYTPYSGGRRTCVSPYTETAIGSSEDVSPPPEADDSYAEDAGAPSFETGYVSTDANESAYVAQDHVSYCFSRYRSYRPEDNSYQPYGGGPRRQCR
jgi:BA14K-like protein